jgi:hypothetical protein
MPAWRAICVAVGLIALFAVLALLFIKPNRVSAQVVGETNQHHRVLIRNPTAHPYNVVAWGEFYANDAWERLSLSNTFLKVEPASVIETGILMPTNRPRRIALVYRSIKTRGFGLWINQARTRLRLQQPVDWQYIEVE